MTEKTEAPEISNLPQTPPQKRVRPPILYVNDFVINGTLSEVSFTFIQEGAPVVNGIIVMNLSVAKEFSEQLSATIAETESILQSPILSTSEGMERREAHRVREAQNKIFKKSIEGELKGDPVEITVHGAIYYQNVWLDCEKCKVSTRFEKVPKGIRVNLKCSNPQCDSIKELCMGTK